MLKAFGVTKVLPKIHVAKVHYGQTSASMVVDRWWYRGKDLYAAYNTDQIFQDAQFKTVGKEELRLSDSVHSVLPSYYRNNIGLINVHLGKIKALSADLKTGQPPAGRSLKMTSAAVFAVFVCLVFYRTYAKYTEFTGEPKQISAQQIQAPVIQKEITPTIAPLVPPVVVETAPLDVIEKMTKNAIIKVSSYVVADSQINAILHLTEGDNESVITLADARAIGYVATLQGKFATVSKANYSFSFQLPN